jgi:hypothetical protein
MLMAAKASITSFVGLAMGGDAQARPRGGQDGPVYAVGAGEGQGGRQLVQPQAPLLVHRLVLQPDAETAGGDGESLGNDEAVPIQPDIDGGAGIHGVGQRDQTDPQAGKTRHRIAHQAKIQHVLHVGRRQDRHLEILEGELGLGRQRRGLAAVVVAGHRQHPALAPGPGEIGVLERIAGAVDAGRLAVPHAADTVVEGAGEQVGLLAAPDRGGGQVLVEAFLEDDLVVGEHPVSPVRLLVEAAQRRAAIAGDETRGVEASAQIQAALIEHHPDQGLHPGDEDPAGFQRVFVVQGHFGVAHGVYPSPVAALALFGGSPTRISR